MEVLRDGQVLSLSYTLEQPLLVIPPKPKRLSYLIVAGLVFLPISMELLNQRFLIKSLGDYGVPAPIKALELFCKVCAWRGEAAGWGEMTIGSVHHNLFTRSPSPRPTP